MTSTFTEYIYTLPLTDDIFTALNTSSARPMLRKNAYLSDYQWEALWEKKLPSDEAGWLVDRVLTSPQVDTVLSSETRGTVLLSLCKNSPLTSEQLERVVCNGKASPSFLVDFIKLPHATDEARALAAQYLTGPYRLEWVATFDIASMSDEQLADEIRAAAHKNVPIRHIKTLNAAVLKILNTRPGVVDELFREEVPSSLHTVLAGSRFIGRREYQEALVEDASSVHEFTALALCANPVVHHDVVEALEGSTSSKVQDALRRRRTAMLDVVSPNFADIDDPDVLTRLMRRSLPTQYKPSGRPGDLIELARNSTLTAADREKIAIALYNVSTREVSVDILNDTCRRLAMECNQPVPPEREDTGFWSTSWFSPPSKQAHHRTYLDPRENPWTQQRASEAFSHIADHTLRVFCERDLSSVIYEPPESAHAYLVHELGDVPSRWEVLCVLAPTHRGSLRQLCDAARRLAR